ncbi:MAG: hypothetical protein JWO84_455 [Parcubacteria group bacterium]|nr:hypothetical protein [Parcubacteria group bacterium]
MFEIFNRGDQVTWRPEDELPEVIKSNLTDNVAEFGLGPFTVERIENARSFAGFNPAHPQRVMVSFEGKLILHQFSGICFAKANLDGTH